MSEMDDLIFHCKVEHPGLKHIAKKNKRPIFSRGGRPTLGKSDELVSQEKILEFHFIHERKKQGVQLAEKPKRRKPKDAPQYHVIYGFHFGPDNSFGYYKSDLTNLMEIVSDSLQKAQIIEDDRFIQSVDGSRKTLSDKTYLEVYVLKYKGD